MKKLYALILALILLCAPLLSSCDKNTDPAIPTEAIAAARDKLLNEAYKATTSVIIDTSDTELKNIISASSGNSIILLSDVDRLMISSEAQIGEINLKTVYTAIGDNVYKESAIRVGGAYAKELLHSTLNIQDKAVLISRFGTGADISERDFDTVETTLTDGVYTVTSTLIKQSSKEGLEKIFKASTGCDVSISDVCYVMTLKDNALLATALTYTITLAADNEFKTVTITTATTYDYDTFIIIPEIPNAADYTTVTFTEICN